jgi:DNA/RNA-binding domain of Phe-tRNA-synthetase-like protein
VSSSRSIDALPFYRLTIDARVGEGCFPVLIWAEGIDAPDACSRPASLDEVLASAKDGQSPVLGAVQQEVRTMLRHGTYKPSGRGKPASEFLLHAARRGEFPLVNGPVDANNAISLTSGLPGSIFDADLTGPALCLRHGLPGEAYVFNPSGQSIDLEDLVVFCRAREGSWEPCGSPIKDSMATKVRADTRNVVAVLYAPRSLGTAFAMLWGERFAELLAASCRARAVGFCGPEALPASYESTFPKRSQCTRDASN